MARDPERHALVLRSMREAGLNALACFSPTDVLLMTGYWPVMGTSLAVMSADGECIVILPEDDLDLARATTGARLIPYQPETLEHLTSPAEVLPTPAREMAQSLRLGNGRLGVQLHGGMQAVPYPSVHHFRESILPVLAEAFPHAHTEASADLLAHLRAALTPIELGLLRQACQLAAVGFAAAPAAIVPGRREDEVAAEIQAAFLRVANDGFERGMGTFFCMSGPNAATAAAAYARTRRRVLREGDYVMIHANTTGDGYWTDITRNYTVGAQSEQQRDVHAAIMKAREAALRAIAPGAQAAEVDRAARAVLAAHGYGPEFKHALGHGVGFAAADALAIPRLHPKSPDVLAAGMTFNVEPAVYFKGIGGMRHCDVIACTERGAEVLTDF